MYTPRTGFRRNRRMSSVIIIKIMLAGIDDDVDERSLLWEVSVRSCAGKQNRVLTRYARPVRRLGRGGERNEKRIDNGPSIPVGEKTDLF